MNVLEVIQSTTAYLEKRGVESPRLNAEHLMAHALGKKNRMEVYLEFDRPLGEQDLAPLRDLVKARGNRTPLQHILGTVEFFGHEFLSDARALIPRSETEQLVELALTLVPDAKHIADVGTGSGVIAISLALKIPSSQVTALDVSDDALALATANAERHAVTDRITLLQSDLLSALPDVARFDLIAANLPYIPTGDIAGLAPEVLCDPSAALDGGTDGLDLIRRLVDEARRFLNPGATLLLEIGHDHAAAVSGLLETQKYSNIRIHPDYQSVERFISATHG